MTENNDEKKEEETKENEPIAQTTPREKNLVDEAREERLRIEKAREDLKKENDRTEKLQAQKALGGQTQAGFNEQPKISEAEKEHNKKLIAVGKATGAKWADDMENKKNGNN